MAPRTSRTPEKRAAFLLALEETASVTKACSKSRLPRQSAYDWRRDDEEFAKDWEDALERGTDALEDEAVRRAFDGTLKPVFYLGSKCGAIREYSDTLLIFLLKGRRPEKYKDRSAHELTGKDGKPLIPTKPEDLTDEQLAAIAAAGSTTTA